MRALYRSVCVTPQISAAFLCVLFFLAPVYSQDDSAAAVNVGQGIRRITGRLLIAKKETDFKNAVAEKVRAAMVDAGVAVEVVDISLLKKQTAAAFDAVVVINEVRAWRLDRQAKTFLRTLDAAERKKVVMVTTAATGWKLKDTTVDAVTVASAMNTADARAGDIVAKLMPLLGNR